MSFALLSRYLIACCLLAFSTHTAFAERPTPPAATTVAELYEHLQVINGDANEGPVICFPQGVGRLDADSWRRHKQTQRLVEISSQIRRLRTLLSAARQAGGSPYPALVIRVIGHADNTASSRDNLEISYRRAQSVGAKLRDRLAGLRVLIAVEGRGEYEPGPSVSCSKIGNKDDGASAERRVEIQFSTTALTHVTLGAANAGLRLYTQATMPGRLQSFVVVEGELRNALLADGTSGNLGKCSSEGDTARQLSTTWQEIGPTPVSVLDSISARLFVRMRAYPLLGQSDVGQDVRARIVLDVATDAKGKGVPDYWALQQRLGAVFSDAKWNTTDGAAWKALKTCNMELGPSYNEQDPPPKRKIKLEMPDSAVLKQILDDAPKDLHGIMLHANRLDRDLHFFDVQPGMGLTFRPVTSEYADGVNPSAFPSGPFEIATKPDPIDPCTAIPQPRRVSALDSVSGLSSSTDVAVADPFLAYMLSGRGVGRGMCTTSGSSGVAPNGLAKTPPTLAPPTVARNVASKGGAPTVAPLDTPPDTYDGVNRVRVPYWIPLTSQLALEAFLQSGVVRVFLPRQLVPKNFVPGEVGDLNSFATIVVAAPSRKRLDEFTGSKGSDLRVHDWCNQKFTDIGCAYLLGGATLSPSVEIEVEGRRQRHYLGTRLTHVLPRHVQGSCFKPDDKGDKVLPDWPKPAKLASGVALRIGDTQPTLMDRHDCRLLGVMLPQGSSVSW